MKFLEVQELLTNAGFELFMLKPIANEYWPDDTDHADIRMANPWWIATTEYGDIKIGNRKRVINIDWRESDIRGIVTPHNVTKDLTMVHAPTSAAAIEYLAELFNIAVRCLGPGKRTLPIEKKFDAKTLTITAHSRDCNNIEAIHKDGSVLTLTDFTHGYVPEGMGIGGGDDIELEIDIATGQILNWNENMVRVRIQEIIDGDDA